MSIALENRVRELERKMARLEAIIETINPPLGNPAAQAQIAAAVDAVKRGPGRPPKAAA